AVQVVAVESLYDEFNYGIFSPYAIRDFLVYCRAAWQPPAPQYVVLAGDGTFDYRDDEEAGHVSYIPVKMLHSLDFGEAPCDNWYGVLDGGDAYLPDLYVGRLPAFSTNDAAQMVSKILGYEGLGVDQPWMTNVMLVADDGDSHYENLCNAVISSLPEQWTSTQVYRGAYGTAAACKAAVSNAFLNGALLAVYSGHGAMDQWANEGLLRSADVPSLANAPRLPFVVTPTCENGYFAYYEECIASALLRSTNGGAIACFSPSGISDPPDQQRLVEGLTQALFAEGAFGLGPATYEARRFMYEALGDEGRNIIQTFNLFGDPSMQLKKPSTYPGDGAPPSVLSTEPTNHCISVDVSTEIRVVFSKPMNKVAARRAFSISPAVEGSLRWDGDALVFAPLASLQALTTYTVSVSSTATDLAGTPLPGYVFDFRPSRQTLSGSIAYSGGQTGVIWVIAGLASDDWGSMGNKVMLDTPGHYDVASPAFATYWMKAFRDSNGNGILDYVEARSTNLCLVIVTNDTAGLDLVLTDPDFTDTDRDGLSDLYEISHSIDPVKCDTDDDAISDGDEVNRYGTDPLKADTDDDSMNDGDELIAGTSPIDRNDVFLVDAIQPEVAVPALLISVETKTGRWYTLRTSAALEDPASWSNVEERLGTGGLSIFTNYPDAPIQFYFIDVRLDP
ncbi:MAG: C25 family cysteine peptidase, partial [Lentisphaerota bacterium]